MEPQVDCNLGIFLFDSSPRMTIYNLMLRRISLSPLSRSRPESPFMPPRTIPLREEDWLHSAFFHFESLVLNFGLSYSNKEFK